jgi:hypothetical protein
MSGMYFLDYVCFLRLFLFFFPFGVWVAAVNAFGTADRMREEAAEGGFIECISRVIKFDSKQTQKFM